MWIMYIVGGLNQMEKSMRLLTDTADTVTTTRSFDNGVFDGIGGGI